MIAFDTEDDSQGSVKIVNFFDGQDHITYRGEKCRYKAWGYLHEHPNEMYWGANCAYDLVNLFGPWLGKVVTLQYVASGLMRGSYRLAKGTFYDTFRHWPATVEQMGKAIGLPKLSMPHLGCDCDDCVDYCRRDTEITWRFVTEMLSRYEAIGLDSLRSTLPSMALQLFKQFYTKDFCRLEDYHLNAIQKAYYGGRVEVYRLGVIHGTINHYDVNSLFPSVMLGGRYPDTDSISVTLKPDFKREGIFEGSVYIPRTDYPCLPVRDNELIFPYGFVNGSWPYPEIRQLLEDGGKIIKCKEAIEFDEVEEPFTGYVKYCYKHRQESKTELDNVFWKLMLNSLYGKFGQTSALEMIFDDREVILDAKAKHANIIWSAYTTSYARLALLRFLRSTSSLFYTDTDSLFTYDVLSLGKALGQLKLEGTYSQAEFKGNKFYRVDKLTKAKGVNRKYADEFFEKGKVTFKAPVRYRESRRRGTIPNVWRDIEKRNFKEYTKRKNIGGGMTEPWNIFDYQKHMSR